MNSLVLPKIIEEVVETVRDGEDVPYYLYGTPREIALRLQKKTQGMTTYNQKYPLIILRLPSKEKVMGSSVRYNLNLAIVARTGETLTTEQRYDQIIIPVLKPIYDAFMEALRVNKFSWENPLDGRFPPHEKIDRPFFGELVDGSNDSYVFDDFLDAIEILNLEVYRNIICE